MFIIVPSFGGALATFVIEILLANAPEAAIFVDGVSAAEDFYKVVVYCFN